MPYMDMAKTALLLAALALAAAACTKYEAKPGSESISNANPNKPSAQEIADQDEYKRSTKSFKFTYRYFLNGCDTGPHWLVADSETELKAQLCATLKNDELNNRCSLSQRLETFQKNCDRKDWMVEYHPENDRFGNLKSSEF